MELARLGTLNRKELQQLCKDLGVKANKKTSELIDIIKTSWKQKGITEENAPEKAKGNTIEGNKNEMPKDLKDTESKRKPKKEESHQNETPKELQEEKDQEDEVKQVIVYENSNEQEGELEIERPLITKGITNPKSNRNNDISIQPTAFQPLQPPQSSSQMEDWVVSNGFSAYLPLFQGENFDIEALKLLNLEALRMMNIPMGDALKILNALGVLETTSLRAHFKELVVEAFGDIQRDISTDSHKVVPDKPYLFITKPHQDQKEREEDHHQDYQEERPTSNESEPQTSITGETERPNKRANNFDSEHLTPNRNLSSEQMNEEK